MEASLLGRVVSARVSRVEPYGLYLKFEGEVVVVLIPDVSREPIADLRKIYDVGQIVEVRVIEFVKEKGVYKGTINDI